MTADFGQIEDAWLGGSADFEAWRESWTKQFFRPLAKTVAAMQLAAIQRNPDVQKNLEEEHGERWKLYVEGLRRFLKEG